MKWKAKRLLYLLVIFNIYCLILGWFSGEAKLAQPFPYFFFFLTFWCVWNSLLTIVFVFWKTKNPRTNDYFAQVFSLITMISNVIAMAIFSIGLIVWLATILTTWWGITGRTIKWVHVPNHNLSNGLNRIDSDKLFKVVRYWLYAPLWHLITPAMFIYWFFRYQKKNFLKQKLWLTIFLGSIMPILYYLYCLLRSKLSPKEHLAYPFHRWPYFFLSSKQMTKKLNINSRFTGKILIGLFWLSLFGLLTYLLVRFSGKIKRFLVNKKEKLAQKSLAIASRFNKKRKLQNKFRK